MSSAEVVLFAIRGALKFGEQARAAYVDSTRRRALVLPLPEFTLGTNYQQAVTYLINHPPQDSPRMQGFVVKLNDNVPLTDEEKQVVLDYHNDQLLAKLPGSSGFATANDGSVVAQSSLDALVTIRQWRREDDPTKSTLQRIAGSLIEIGVDYYLETPGALDTDSKSGRAVKGFLEGLDTISFAEESIGDLPRKLFVITLETLSENPELLSDSAKSQVLIKAATAGIATDVNAKILELRANEGGANLGKEEAIRFWGETVFRSLLTSTARTVLEDPTKFLDVDDAGKSALISKVGGSFLDMVDEIPFGELESIFSEKTLEAVTDAALAAVAEHPELVSGDNSRLGPLITQLAKDMKAMDTLYSRQSIPEITRLVLVATGENLEIIWPPGDEPGKNLALLAAKNTIEVLSAQAPQGSSWQLSFSSTDLEQVVELVVDDIAESPVWLANALDEHDGKLKPVLTAVLASIRDRGDQKLLTRETAVGLISVAMHSAAQSSDFVKTVPNRGPFIAALVNIILDSAFSDSSKVSWRMVKYEFLVGLTDHLVEELQNYSMDDAKLESVLTAVESELDSYAQRLRVGGDVSLDGLLAKLKTEIEGVVQS